MYSNRPQPTHKIYPYPLSYDISYDSELLAPALELIQEQIFAWLVDVFGSLAITYKLEYIHSQIAIVTKGGDMDQKEREERKMRAIKYARKQLVEGTWPQVMAVFEYKNPKAPRTPDEEFALLEALYKRASCPNIATFIELVHFAEREHDVTKSFNISLCRRLVRGKIPKLTAKNSISLFITCPDILVGTRGGIEGAVTWLKTFSEAMPRVPPELIQVMDKIFGEAVEFLRDPSLAMIVKEMLAVTSCAGDVLQLPGKQLRH